MNSTEVPLPSCSWYFFPRHFLEAGAGLAHRYFRNSNCLISFFSAPYYTLNISGPDNWSRLEHSFITALIAGQLSANARATCGRVGNAPEKIEGLYENLRRPSSRSVKRKRTRSEKLKSALLDASRTTSGRPLTSIKASVTTLLGGTDGTDLDEVLKRILNIINEETDRQTFH